MTATFPVDWQTHVKAGKKPTIGLTSSKRTSESLLDDALQLLSDHNYDDEEYGDITVEWQYGFGTKLDPDDGEGISSSTSDTQIGSANLDKAFASMRTSKACLI